MLKEEINLERLNEKIRELEIDGDTVIAFDFDELVVPMHLTHEIVMKISAPIDEEIVSNLGGKSYEKIRYLNSLLVGNNYIAYKNLIKKETRMAEWTPGFKELLEFLMKKYSLIFISSGLRDVCEAKLSEINFNPKNIIAGELDAQNDIINDSKIIVSDKLKGHVINSLNGKYQTISVGHGLGDKNMLENSHVSISFNSKIPGLAKFDVKNPEEIIGLIEESSHSVKD
jgi:phosphoserine phosphatase